MSRRGSLYGFRFIMPIFLYMGCRYCGKEIPLRMRLTGEEHFCCPAHKKLHQEEHSRMGLARLLEEVSPASCEPETPAEQAPAQVTGTGKESAEQPGPESMAADGDEVTPAAETNLEEELRRFPLFKFLPDPVFGPLNRVEFEPADYAPGRPEVQPASSGEPVIHSAQLGGEFKGVLPLSTGKTERATAAAAAEVHETAAVVTAQPGGAASKQTTKTKAGSPAPRSKPTTATTQPSQTTRVTPPRGKRVGKRVHGSPAADIEFHFGGSLEKPAARSVKSRVLKFAIAGIVGILLGGTGYLVVHQEGSTTRAQAISADAAASSQWIEGWPGPEAGGHVVLFGPSTKWPDYRIEAKVNRYTGLEWVFRATDPRNFYTAKLEIGGNESTMNIIWGAVVDGGALEQVKKTFPAPGTKSGLISVQLEVRGTEFRLFVDGALASRWSDDLLQTGGAGVLLKNTRILRAENVKVTRLGASTSDRFPPTAAGSRGNTYGTMAVTGTGKRLGNGAPWNPSRKGDGG